MFDIGFLELLIVALIALIVLGPERLPTAIKVTAIWVGRIKRSFQNVRSEIERELNADEIRRDVHNAAVMDELKKAREDLEREVGSVRSDLQSATDDINAADKRNVQSADNPNDKG
ncbi:Sec-independent protein translocase protein TatB [Sansalvadorimonas sp. 2012CJ34-2]|uniref:Sec-independent protein translocase protein TatB n=1 Tax=Parendozoicomonas callyspongiae TaxID=2942213 RepID=A0ABT0PH73_9GAMM|nr:Sec-independent protein translocase protein TatB [Sansalvadorimonas sp. 2012CJ34-2]